MIRVWGLGLVLRGLDSAAGLTRFRVESLGLRGLGPRVSGLRVSGIGLKVASSGFGLLWRQLLQLQHLGSSSKQSS